MILGWAIEHSVISNSVLNVKDGCTVGIGTDEQDRAGVAEIAIYKAYIKYADIVSLISTYGIGYAGLELSIAKGEKRVQKTEIDQTLQSDHVGFPDSVMIYDAFFPFRDGADEGRKRQFQQHKE